jgi:hypothetical protein
MCSKAKENPRAQPPPPGGLITEVVGAGHGSLAAQVVEGVARKRTRCGRCCRAACN